MNSYSSTFGIDCVWYSLLAWLWHLVPRHGSLDFVGNHLNPWQLQKLFLGASHGSASGDSPAQIFFCICRPALIFCSVLLNPFAWNSSELLLRAYQKFCLKFKWISAFTYSKLYSATLIQRCSDVEFLFGLIKFYCLGVNFIVLNSWQNFRFIDSLQIWFYLLQGLYQCTLM